MLWLAPVRRRALYLMKFAIFGDIHANLEALETVLADAKEQGCTNYACIGDIVGYNANPSECVHIVRELGCPVVKGNHDDEAVDDTPLDGLNPLAKEALDAHLNYMKSVGLLK